MRKASEGAWLECWFCWLYLLVSGGWTCDRWRDQLSCLGFLEEGGADAWREVWETEFWVELRGWG